MSDKFVSGKTTNIFTPVVPAEVVDGLSEITSGVEKFKSDIDKQFETLQSGIDEMSKNTKTSIRDLTDSLKNMDDDMTTSFNHITYLHQLMYRVLLSRPMLILNKFFNWYIVDFTIKYFHFKRGEIIPQDIECAEVHIISSAECTKGECTDIKRRSKADYKLYKKYKRRSYDIPINYV